MSGVSGVGDKKSLSKSADIKIGLRAPSVLQLFNPHHDQVHLDLHINESSRMAAGFSNWHAGQLAVWTFRPGGWDLPSLLYNRICRRNHN